MSVMGTALDGYIENKLMNLHTAFLAKIVGVKGNRLNIKPLHMYKEVGSPAQEYPVISDVPYISRSYNIEISQETHKHQIAQTESAGSVETIPVTHTHTITEKPYKVGDIVLAIVCERDITNALQGKTTLPYTNNRHNLHDTVVVGRLA